METIEKLEVLGFKKAAERARQEIPVLSKVVVAKEHYRFVTDEQFERAQGEIKAKSLKKVTRKDISFGGFEEVTTYCTIRMTEVGSYEGIPPAHVLESMEKAVALGCFDGFHVATLERVSEVRKFSIPDPILFGHITGFKGMFFIDQWGDDVRIEDVLRPAEG